MDSYSENILDRFRSPLHRGSTVSFDASARDLHPSCGDEFTVSFKLDSAGRVVDAKFSGQGCAISTAALDLLLDELIGKKFDSIKTLDREVVFNLLGVSISPVRAKCALLGLKICKLAFYSQSGKKMVEKDGEFG